MIKFRLTLFQEYLVLGGAGLLLLLLIVQAGLPLLRLILTLLFVLFVPGYYLQLLFFPQRQALDPIIRGAMAVGLSIALIPAVVLLLEALPDVALRTNTIVLAQTVVVLFIGGGAALRRQHIPAEERFTLGLEIAVMPWWRQQALLDRAVLVGLGVLLVVIVATTTLVLTSPSPAEQFTVFYVLGQGGRVEDYPRQVAPGEVVELTIGVENNEGHAQTYTVEAWQAGQLIGGLAPFLVEDGSRLETTLTIQGEQLSEPAELLLFREGETQPLRRLLLWLS